MTDWGNVVKYGVIGFLALNVIGAIKKLSEIKFEMPKIEIPSPTVIIQDVDKKIRQWRKEEETVRAKTSTSYRLLTKETIERKSPVYQAIPFLGWGMWEEPIKNVVFVVERNGVDVGIVSSDYIPRRGEKLFRYTLNEQGRLDDHSKILIRG